MPFHTWKRLIYLSLFIRYKFSSAVVLLSSFPARPLIYSLRSDLKVGLFTMFAMLMIYQSYLGQEYKVSNDVRVCWKVDFLVLRKSFKQTLRNEGSLFGILLKFSSN